MTQKEKLEGGDIKFNPSLTSRAAGKKRKTRRLSVNTLWIICPADCGLYGNTSKLNTQFVVLFKSTEQHLSVYLKRPPASVCDAAATKSAQQLCP